MLDRVLLGVAIGGEAEQAEQGEAGGAHQRVVLRDQQVLQHGHAGEQADVLEGARDLGVLGDAEVEQPLQRESAGRRRA